MTFYSDIHNRAIIDTGYEYRGRQNNSYVYTGFVDDFMKKIHENEWDGPKGKHRSL